MLEVCRRSQRVAPLSGASTTLVHLCSLADQGAQGVFDPSSGAPSDQLTDWCRTSNMFISLWTFPHVCTSS